MNQRPLRLLPAADRYKNERCSAARLCNRASVCGLYLLVQRNEISLQGALREVSKGRHLDDLSDSDTVRPYTCTQATHIPTRRCQVVSMLHMWKRLCPACARARVNPQRPRSCSDPLSRATTELFTCTLSGRTSRVSAKPLESNTCTISTNVTSGRLPNPCHHSPNSNTRTHTKSTPVNVYF